MSMTFATREVHDEYHRRTGDAGEYDIIIGNTDTAPVNLSTARQLVTDNLNTYKQIWFIKVS